MIWTVAGRELRALFLSPVAWSLFAVALIILAWLFLVQIEGFLQIQPTLNTGSASLGVSDLVVAPLLDAAALILLLLTPLLTMRLLAEEYRSGTIRLLLSAPIPLTRIVLGKYLAQVVLFLLMLAITALLPLSLLLGTQLDIGRLLASLLGLALLLACFSAIGLFLSGLTRQPAVAAVSSYGVLLFLWIVSLPRGEASSPLFDWLSLAGHYRPFLAGLLRSVDLGYFLLLIAASLAMTVYHMDRSRGTGGSMPDRHLARFARRLNGVLFYLLLALAVGLSGWLSHRYQVTFDWSDRGRNSLSAVSQRLLERIQGPLEIRSFAPSNEALRQRIRAVIEPYQRSHPEISLEFIDPASEPELTRQAGIQRSGELRLSYQGRTENLSTLNEAAISNAIQRLIQRETRWIVGITGHGERVLTGQANHDLGRFGEVLTSKGYQLQSLDLSRQGAIPHNTNLLVLAGPRIAYLPGELQLVADYIAGGGNLLWLTDPGAQHDLPDLFQPLGLRVLPGTVVDANAARLGLDNPAIAVVSQFPAHPATARFELITLYPMAAALEANPSAPWQAVPLLQTQPGSWNETGALKGELQRDPAAGEMPGPLTLGYAISRPLEDATQRILIIGDGDFLSNSYLGNGGNLDLGLNLIRWLSEDDILLDIPVSTVPDRQLELSRTEGALIAFGFLFLLPALLIGCGLVIRWRRQRS